MVYLDKDFYSTLVGNEKKGNAMENRELILEQIAELIVADKASVIEALNASGIPTANTASQGRVVSAIVKNAPTNKKLRLGLAYLISQKRMSEGHSNSIGDFLFGKSQEAKAAVGTVAKSTAEGGAAGGAGGGIIGGIIGAVSGAVGGVFNYKASKEAAKAQEEANRSKILDFIQKRQGGSNTGLYIGLSLLVVAGIVTFIVLKRKK